MLVDQDRCRGWRFCVSGCPYKKVYFNHRTGKAEKCPYEDIVAAVCAQLPRLSRRELGQVLTAFQTGPPREEVGLEPFAPPDYLAGYRVEP